MIVSGNILNFIDLISSHYSGLYVVTQNLVGGWQIPEQLIWIFTSSPHNE